MHWRRRQLTYHCPARFKPLRENRAPRPTHPAARHTSRTNIMGRRLTHVCFAGGHRAHVRAFKPLLISCIMYWACRLIQHVSLFMRGISIPALLLRARFTYRYRGCDAPFKTAALIKRTRDILRACSGKGALCAKKDKHAPYCRRLTGLRLILWRAYTARDLSGGAPAQKVASPAIISTLNKTYTP